MEFAFTDEQKMIRDTVESFLAENSTSAAVRSAMESAQGFDPALWNTLCNDLYWQGTHIPVEYGGLGLGYVELVAMLEQMGRFLLCSPFYSTVCLAANALLVAGDSYQKTDYLAKICEGETATLAWASRSAAQAGGRWDASAVEATVVRHDEQFQLNGRYRYVTDGASADWLVLAARTPNTTGNSGISLFIVAADQAGIQRNALPTMDQTRRQAEIIVENLNVPIAALMGRFGEAGGALETVLDLATIALAAEQMGGAQQCLDMAVAYTKERVQFGRSIASFQAIKHMAADMMTRVEVARSGVYYAACVAQEKLDALNGLHATLVGGVSSAGELPEAASIAKSYCSDAYFRNAADALQMHGGVGFTWEYDVHLHFKRAKATEHFLGNAAWHRERLAQLLLDADQESSL
ncbi:Predicted acyl-CoA dehydrogenase [gamma proteobacterium HdN1]|nr:Predicted acyl-CoA dehydrogenase [gamma proteobacterium HdN1]